MGTDATVALHARENPGTFVVRLRVKESADPNGVITKYGYDDRGNITMQTEAAGTDDERTTTFTYHEDYSLVASIVRESVGAPGQSAVTTIKPRCKRKSD